MEEEENTRSDWLFFGFVVACLGIGLLYLMRDPNPPLRRGWGRGWF